MRFLDLQLLRFGPYTERVLDFDPDSGLQLVFGSNEAGKSTALRAIAGLLYGIPKRTRDAHLHPMPELRVGARLENRAGRRLHVIRRKGDKDTLLDAAETPLDEAVLKAFLGGVGPELFETQFGLSHQKLVEGGAALLAGRGELGGSLFGAGLGMRSLHAVRSRLQAEAEALFTPAAQKKPLNQALKAFQDARKRSQQALLKPQDWRTWVEQRQAAEERLAGLERGHAAHRSELSRLQRLQRVQATVRKRETLLEQKTALGQVRWLPDGCTEERSQIQATLRRVDEQKQKLQEEQARCEQDRAALVIPEALLARESALESLRERLGAHRKALNDLPGLEGGVAAARAEAEGLLRELGRTESPDESGVPIDAAAQARIRRLGQQGVRLESDLDKARQDLAEAEGRQQALGRRLEALPPVRDAGALHRAVSEARRRGDPEEQLRVLDVELAGLAEKVEKQRRALPLWQGPADEVAHLPLPSLETVERFHGEFTAWRDDERRLADKRDELGRQLEATRRRMAELEGHGSVPSEAELHQARRDRDVLWRRVRDAWQAGQPVCFDLLTRYEDRFKKTDEVADRLWREADRAAQYATLDQQARDDAAALERLEADLEALEQRRQALAAEWRRHWPGIEPLPPAEMRGWLGQHEKLVEVVARWRERERERESLEGVIRAHRARCERELTDLGKPPTYEPLSVVLEHAETLAAAIDDLERDRRQLRGELAEAEDERRRRAETLARSEQALAAWRAHWTQAIAPLGLPPEAAIEEAEAVLNGFARLAQKLGEIRRDQTRIDHIRRDAAEFAAHVAALCRDCACGLENRPAEEAADALAKQLRQACEDLATRNGLDKRLKQIRRDLDALRGERERAQANLQQLLAQAEVETIEELEAAEERSRAWRDLTAKLDDLQEQLLAESMPLEALIEEAKAADPDRLPAAIERLQEAVARSEQDCQACREEVWTRRRELQALDGTSAAALAAAEAQEALASIKTRVERYVHLRLASLVLGREIERYRERHQGPLVRRAGELLARMTLGAFAGLSTGFGEDDRLQLLGVRDDGRRVPVEGLSEGTRDQLYLALRLASLERHLAHAEPLPLVVDDVLINFDDRRAEATLALLGELAGQTQVLFFTHHRRLLELAHRAVPPARLKEHDLDRLQQIPS